jgi:hypothetical protein
MGSPSNCIGERDWHAGAYQMSLRSIVTRHGTVERIILILNELVFIRIESQVVIPRSRGLLNGLWQRGSMVIAKVTEISVCKVLHRLLTVFCLVDRLPQIQDC